MVYSSAEKSCWGRFPALHCNSRDCSQAAHEFQAAWERGHFCPMPLGFDPMPCGISRAESQRDSDPKPRDASRELPWEKRVVSANPNGVVARWRSGDTTPVGLKIARTLTQGSLADSATLGWRTQSLWDWRTTGVSVVPCGNGRRKPEIRRPKVEGRKKAEIRRPKEGQSSNRARPSGFGFQLSSAFEVWPAFGIKGRSTRGVAFPAEAR